MNVRPATPADAEAMACTLAIVAPEGSIGSEAPVDVHARAGQFRAMLDSSTRDAAWVLELDGQVMGHAAVTERPAGVLYLGMVIRPPARGQGGGRALLECVRQHARRSGAHKIDLEVWTDNGRAIALYSSAGYQVEGIRHKHYRRRDGQRRSAVIMALEITPDQDRLE